MKSLPFRFLVLIPFLFSCFAALAQVPNDEVLMTIAEKNVTVGEFLAIYQKNNVKNQPIDQESLNEYLDLFINFKLKVREAEDLGLDTLTSFRTELAGYREQLAKPYFTDEATIERLVAEAYDRSGTDIRASHIFIRLKPDALPEDTLVAWQKVSQIRERILKGESFEALAWELSEDPSARDREANAQHPFIKGNRGDLGYFTVFDMVYPFETEAYTTEIGKVSMPVRSEYGYHLIKVSKKQPAMGKVTVAHLYMSIPKTATAQDSLRVQARIDSICNKLKAGAKWDSLVRLYSDDKGSASRGGTLPKFGVNRMVPEFIEAIYQLKNPGDFSGPILTGYGWHIIRLEEREAQPPFEQMKADMKQKVLKDSRSQIGRDVVLQNIIKEYGLKQYPEARQAFSTVVTDSIFFGKWDVALAKELNKPLFKIGDQVTTQQDFANWLASKQKKREKINVQAYVNNQYKDFLNDRLMRYEDKHLEGKYPEFHALMNEYRDGILLFDLTDKNVWSKAVKDTTGLKEFFEKNKGNYMWESRIDASVYIAKDPDILTKARNFLSTGLSDDNILKEINADTGKSLTIESGKFQRADNPYLEKIKWEAGLSPTIKSDTASAFVNVRAVLKPEPKQLNDARGLITADYQNFLEKEWIRDLKKKYPVVVHREVLLKIR